MSEQKAPLMHPLHLPRHPRSPGDTATSTSITLIEGVKVQDGEAWRRLVFLYTPLLRYWCRRWGVAGEDVNDVLQEVFQAVFCSLKNFRRDREGDSFRAWLRGVARNKSMLLFRRRGSMRSLGEPDLIRYSLLIPDPKCEPTAHEEGELVGGLYQNALKIVRGEFEDRTWQAFWKVTVEGRASTDIANELGISAAAVRQAKSRVLRRLKDVLGEPSKP
jgi:RNA polymerase sigma-70 factor (ECF subfamily)